MGCGVYLSKYGIYWKETGRLFSLSSRYVLLDSDDIAAALARVHLHCKNSSSRCLFLDWFVMFLKQ